MNDEAPDVSHADRDRKIRQAYTLATQELRETYPEEFNKLRIKHAHRLGIEWEPRPSRSQKAQAELDRLLVEYPELLDHLAERVAEADTT